jgi:HNH endonuclease
MKPWQERFWAKVNKTDGCWEWTAHIMPNGYGHLQMRRPDGRWGHQYAHRLAYELLVGPIPEGLTIDHLCRNRRCVRPDHLEAVTLAENVRRGIDPPRATHCRRGHPFTPDNTRTDKRGRRTCITCKRASSKADYRRKRTAILARHKAWREANPTYMREYHRARRAS